MAAGSAVPIDENKRFLALLVAYVSRVSGPRPAGGHTGNCRVFYRLLRAMGERPTG